VGGEAGGKPGEGCSGIGKKNAELQREFGVAE
jgi:hypothetical protein